MLPQWSDVIFFLQSPWAWVHFVLGAVVGSFLNVVILRLPAKTFWKYSRSVCPYCESPIPFYLNIPIFSFFLLRGRAACCRVKLSWQYPAVELVTAVLFMMAYYKFPYLGEAFRRVNIDHPDMIRFYHLAIFVSLLMICSVIDLRHMIIPDVISIPMILASPLVVYYHDLTWKSSLFGVLVGGGLLYGVAWLYWIVRREIGLGFGDVKLLAAIGGWLGVEAIIPTILIGSISGTIVGVLALVLRRDMSMRTALPFGPFLALGAVVYMFCDISFIGP